MTIAWMGYALRKLHLWIGIGIGLQVGLWLISGLFMTLFPIETVRGSHLRADMTSAPVTGTVGLVATQDIITAAPGPVDAVTLTMLGEREVYRVTSHHSITLFDARSGAQISPLGQDSARLIARRAYAGAGVIKDITYFHDNAPREFGRDEPVWQVNFSAPDKASFYIAANTGEVKAVRTGLWRTFDFMWGLHIMDWKNRKNFNSWWIKSVSVLGVIFFFSGFGLIVMRILAMIRRSRARRDLGI